MNIKLFKEKLKIYGIKKSIQYGISETVGRLYKETVQKSYSQQGEDLIIDKLLNYKKKGTYIDIGAFDPVRLSNTKRFYEKGWKGVNIEPDYNNYLKFVKLRPNDINLNIGISNKKDILKFFRFNVDTLSTFSKQEAEKYKKQGYKLLETIDVEVRTLSSIFSDVLKTNKIDFLSVDTEGYDLEVLKSNDWNKYRPKIVCVETLIHSVNNEKMISKDIIEFLKQKGYKEVADTGINTIFLDEINKL